MATKKCFTIAVLVCASTALSAQTTPTESTNKTAENKKIVHRDLATREVQSGHASGTTEVKSPRDAATGQASGKRVAPGDVSNDGAKEVKSPRDSATGQASGKRQHTPGKMTGANSNPLYKDDGKQGTNPLHEEKK